METDSPEAKDTIEDTALPQAFAPGNAFAFPAKDAQDITIEIRDDAVPCFVEAELRRLYAHIFSSLLQFKVYGQMDGKVGTYAVRRNGEIVTLYLFRREHGMVTVLNQSIPVSDEDAGRFARHVFERYAGVGRVCFHAVLARSGTRRLAFAQQRHNCAEDIVIALPSNADAYFASLGKNTRRNIRRYMDRLLKTFPSFRCDVAEGAAIGDEVLREIIAFNRARMAGKNKASTLDEAEANRIMRIAGECGLVSVARIDGKICAGGIAYRVGDNFFLYVIAHDPAYNGYWLGILTCYLTIRECIARGGKHFHFLWGRYDYKFALGAVLRELEHIDIYRSRAAMLRNGLAVARIAAAKRINALKLALLDGARRQDSMAFKIVSRLRKAKRSIDGLRGTGGGGPNGRT